MGSGEGGDMGEGETKTLSSRLEMLLPHYLDGSLTGAERGEVEEWLASDPGAAAALEEAEARRSAAQVASEDFRHSEGHARPREPEEAAAQPAPPEQVSTLQRARALIGGVPPSLAWAITVAAVVLLVFQSGARWPTPQAPTITGSIDSPFFVLVSFKEDATISEVSSTMRELGLEFSSGPMAGGLYRVDIPVKSPAEYDALTSQLQGAPPVALLVAGRRPPQR